MKIKVFSQDGKQIGETELSDDLFSIEVNEGLLHQVVVSYAANKRQGTAKTKTRVEVSGGGRKPFKQKGTGRARAGSNTSPLWVRGSKAFGPQPRSYASTIPRKLRKAALRSALADRAQNEKLIVVDSVQCAEIKTKTIAQMLHALSLSGRRNLLVITGEDRNLYLSGRNIKNLEVLPVSQLNAASIVRNDTVILGTSELVQKIEEAVTL